MKLPLLIAGAFACLSFSVFAGECEFPFDKTIGELSAAGAPVSIVPPDELDKVVETIETLLGKDYGDVTRAFFAQAGGNILLGLEVEGCLLPPINLGLAPAAEQLSGRDESGKIGA